MLKLDSSHNTKNMRSNRPSWTPTLQGTPANVRMNLYCQKIESLFYIFAADRMGLSSFRFSYVFWNRVQNGRSRSSKVVDFDTNRKRICNFLLVSNSTVGPIFPRFRDNAGFLLKTAAHPYSTRILGCFFWTRLPMLGPWGAKTLSQLLHNYFQTDPTYTTTVHQRYSHRDGQMDRQTDGRHRIAIPRFAVRESRSKNQLQQQSNDSVLEMWPNLENSR